MCTAVSVKAEKHYFGRNLDYEITFGEKITITPRNYPFTFTNGNKTNNHSAILGTALIERGYPLYFDAVNESGLCVAGLNFPMFAVYNEKKEGKINVASFEIIPWILSRFSSVSEAKPVLQNLNITNEAFCEKLQPTPLHWIIADDSGALVLEQTKDGLTVSDNPTGILTNSPDFNAQLVNAEKFFCLSPDEHGRGNNGEMEAIGLPGDFSSTSRFVRAIFVSRNSVFGKTEEERVVQFFHILSSVQMPKGCVQAEKGFKKTNYSCCYNASNRCYYYKTYFNSRIYETDMYKENLNTEKLITYDMVKEGAITLQNA